jgi:hypothetical protein
MRSRARRQCQRPVDAAHRELAIQRVSARQRCRSGRGAVGLAASFWHVVTCERRPSVPAPGRSERFAYLPPSTGARLRHRCGHDTTCHDTTCHDTTIPVTQAVQRPHRRLSEARLEEAVEERRFGRRRHVTAVTAGRWSRGTASCRSGGPIVASSPSGCPAVTARSSAPRQAPRPRRVPAGRQGVLCAGRHPRSVGERLGTAVIGHRGRLTFRPALPSCRLARWAAGGGVLAAAVTAATAATPLVEMTRLRRHRRPVFNRFEPGGDTPNRA